MPTSSLCTVVKVGRVLELYTREQPEWGVREIAMALSIPKSNAHSLLSTLAATGLLKRTPRGRYRLGWRLLRLSRVLMESTDVRREARWWMAELMTQLGETVHLAALEGGRVVYIDKLVGTRAVRVDVTNVGIELPAHCSGVGKVLLADEPWASVVDIVNTHGLHPYTPNTITTLDELQSELERVRKRGYAYDIEEVVEELCCIAAPVRDLTGRVVAAMSISVPMYRFKESRERYRRFLLEATRGVSERLGFEEEREVSWHATVR